MVESTFLMQNLREKKFLDVLEEIIFQKLQKIYFTKAFTCTVKHATLWSFHLMNEANSLLYQGFEVLANGLETLSMFCSDRIVSLEGRNAEDQRPKDHYWVVYYFPSSFQFNGPLSWLVRSGRGQRLMKCLCCSQEESVLFSPVIS